MLYYVAKTVFSLRKEKYNYQNVYAVKCKQNQIKTPLSKERESIDFFDMLSVTSKKN